MNEDRLITVAIHTYERAVQLKGLLEREGVLVVLQNVNLTQPTTSSGVRCRIHESDLPLALRIIENREIFTADDNAGASESRLIIVPIDFSAHSVKACDIAFHIAYRQKASIILLHTYLDPSISDGVQLSDSLTYEPMNPELGIELDKEARSLMDHFCSQLRERIKQSELPPVKFHSEVVEGVPEEVILEYAKEKKPELIVMGTRGAGKKEAQLIGSVTAEVLDSCRYPVLTIPELESLSTFDDIKHAVLFSNLEQEDILALDMVYRLFSDEQIDVTIVNVPTKKGSKDLNRDSARLLEYCKTHYPRFSFKVAPLSLGNIVEDFQLLQSAQSIDLIAIPNKKKNIFARLFNPSIAHKLLFHSDISMIVIPV
jgi:nucleotide-binding universal stress UspA family protein